MQPPGGTKGAIGKPSVVADASPDSLALIRLCARTWNTYGVFLSRFLTADRGPVRWRALGPAQILPVTCGVVKPPLTASNIQSKRGFPVGIAQPGGASRQHDEKESWKKARSVCDCP